MLFACLGISAVFLAIVSVVALAYKGAAQATLCSLFCLLGVAACTGLEILSLNALLVAVAGAVCWWFRMRTRWFLVSSVGATAAAYVLVALYTHWSWERLKTGYPLESLADRLAYEKRRQPPPTPAREVTPGSPAGAHLASLEQNVNDREKGYRSILRTRSLECLHAGAVQQFIDGPGFGVGRMAMFHPGPYQLEREQGQESPLPQPTPPYSPADLAPAPLQIAPDMDFLAVHDANTLDFVNPGGFGYIQDRDHVAGFRPHQFHENPQSRRPWRINRLELVGILKHDEPVVYLSANFPRMDELSDAPARPLDAFEKEALVKLQGGEDLMVQKTPKQMRMLGSIRAVQQCLQCHSVERGELLGAFSYQLSPEELPSK